MSSASDLPQARVAPVTRRRCAGLPARHRFYPWIAAAAGMIALARCIATFGVFNHTTDELSHIAGSVGLYEAHRNVYMVEHPPLQRLIVGAALRLAGVEYPPARQLDAIPPRSDSNVAGEAIAFHGKVPYWTVLTMARSANLVFLALLLFYVYRWGRYIGNPLAGMFATVLVSLDPNLLGHGALVTTDIPAAAGFLAASYHAIRFAARPAGRTAIIAGIALGLAIACKFTCVLLAPAVLLLMAIRAWRRARAERCAPDLQRALSTHTPGSERSDDPGPASTLGNAPTSFLRRFFLAFPRLRHLAIIPVVAFFTLWATYLFDVGKLRDQEIFSDEKTWLRIPAAVKNMTLPMPSMPLGLMFMAALGKTGFPCYLNGQIDLKGHLLYFPEAMALKMPSAVVLGLAVAGIAWLIVRPKRGIRILCLALPPSLLLLTAMTGKLQIGIRHILPVLPFVYLLLIFVLHRGRWVWVLATITLLAGLEGGASHPDYMAFFNRVSGGPENGSRYLADSNLDWGQDVARLADYLKSTGRPDYTIHVSGARVNALVTYLGLNPASREFDVEKLKAKPHGLLAVGVNARLRLEDFRRNRDGTATSGPDYSWLQAYPMIQRIGYSIEVYDLDAPKHR